MQQTVYCKQAQAGVAALLSIVIISAATLVLATSASFLGLGELDLSFTAQKGGDALFVAEGCLEEALHRIRLDAAYGVGAGPLSLVVSGGSCIIEVEDLGSQRRVTSSGSVADYHKKIEATVTVAGATVSLDAWLEKDN